VYCVGRHMKDYLLVVFSLQFTIRVPLSHALHLLLFSSSIARRIQNYARVRRVRAGVVFVSVPGAILPFRAPNSFGFQLQLSASNWCGFSVYISSVACFQRDLQPML
jgi:hypothetical protein